MKIENVNVPEQDVMGVVNCIPFVIDVVESIGKNGGYFHMLYHQLVYPHFQNRNVQLPTSPIRKFEKAGYENVYNLSHTIPIYLKEQRPETYSENDIVDLLGAYFPNVQNDNPYIELYVKNIEQASAGDDMAYKWLFSVVLIHELAHAALDNHNLQHFHGTEKVAYSTEFGKWIEESMANAIALRIIKEYGNDEFYDYAKDFMKNQTPEYALGVSMEEFDNTHLRNVMRIKKNGTVEELKKEWLKYVKSSAQPDWDTLEKWNEILTSTNVYMYNGEYYTEYNKLAFVIVKAAVTILKEKNSGALSYDQLCEQMPVLMKEDGAHKFGKLAKLDSIDLPSCFYAQKDDLIHLDDGDYALYSYWYEKDMDDIINFANKHSLNVGVVK